MSMSNISMAGKVALITGGKGRVGKAFAQAFANAGAAVAICSSGEKDSELLAVAEGIKKLGRPALALKADVAVKTEVEGMVRKVMGEFGAIDVLINNAGAVAFKTVMETDEADWDRVVDVNLKGAFLCSQAVAREMIEDRKGCIINLASIAGLKAQSPPAAYSVAKAGVVMLTRVLALELGRYNIRVNAIAPGAVKAGTGSPFSSDEEAVKRVLADTPLGRLGEVGDITGVALFLASDAAGWISGQTIAVDGGFLA